MSEGWLGGVVGVGIDGLMLQQPAHGTFGFVAFGWLVLFTQDPESVSVGLDGDSIIWLREESLTITCNNTKSSFLRAV